MTTLPARIRIGEIGLCTSFWKVVSHWSAGVLSAMEARRPETMGAYETERASPEKWRVRYHIARTGPPMNVPHTVMRAVRCQLYESLSGLMMPRWYSKYCDIASPLAQSTPDVTMFARTGYSASAFAYTSHAVCRRVRVFIAISLTASPAVLAASPAFSGRDEVADVKGRNLARASTRALRPARASSMCLFRQFDGHGRRTRAPAAR